VYFTDRGIEELEARRGDEEDPGLEPWGTP